MREARSQQNMSSQPHKPRHYFPSHKKGQLKVERKAEEENITWVAPLPFRDVTPREFSVMRQCRPDGSSRHLSRDGEEKVAGRMKTSISSINRTENRRGD